jgi:Coenzyme PQQ synthesis protein D (PqqD)
MTHPPEGGSSIWKQRDRDLSWRDIDGEVIVLDLRSATYLRFNAVGTVLWLELERGVAGSDLEQLISKRFALDGAQARHDVDAFLQSCLEKDLIELQAP